VIGSAAAILVATTVSVGLTLRGAPSAPATLAATAPALDPQDSSGAELLTPPPADPAAERAAPPRAEVALQAKRRSKDDSDENVWKTEVSRNMPVAQTVESFTVNTGSGDIVVAESPSGQLEIQAAVRARTDLVAKDKLTQAFEDHVDVFEQQGELDAGRLPAGAESRTVAGRDVREYRTPGGAVLVWEAGDVVYTTVSDAPVDQLDDVVADFTPHHDTTLDRVTNFVLGPFSW